MRRCLMVLGLLVSGLSATAWGQPLPEYDRTALEAAIARGDLGKIAVLAVEQHGQAVYRQRFDGAEADEPVDVRSAGKSITALAVGAAIADGALSGTDVAVWPYLGASRGEPFDSITVADLLGMSSALDCDDMNRRSPGQEDRMTRSRVWRDFVLRLPSRSYLRDERGEGPFSYCSAGVFMLGQVVEKATGQRFDRYVQRRIFDPLGIPGAIWKRSPTGEVQSGGQLTITADALLRLGRMVLDKGHWKGEQILPEAWIARMLTVRHSFGPNVVYGNLWWGSAIRSPTGYVSAWMMQGNGGNMVAIVPAYDAVLVVQARNYNRKEADRHAFTALSTMLGMLSRPTEPVPTAR